MATQSRTRSPRSRYPARGSSLGRGRGGTPRPVGEARLSQVITSYGPGAMVDLVDHAVLVSGLDHWRPQDGPSIAEPRLRDRLRSRGLALGDVAFRTPPVSVDKDPDPQHGIPVVEFPTWFVCQNPSCRALRQKSEFERRSDGRHGHHCLQGKPSVCVPVRFVGACTHGHLEDFPWVRFVHGNEPVCRPASLSLHEGRCGDFSEIVIRCSTCNRTRRLSSALVKEQNPTCSGQRPWLGSHASERCQEHVRLLVRTASNSYFTVQESALSVPEPDQQLRDAVLSVFDVVSAATTASLPVFRTIPRVSAAIAPYSDAAVLAAVGDIRDDRQPIERDPLRTAEFKQFIAAPSERAFELPPSTSAFFVRRQAQRPEGLADAIDAVVLCHKLREVRVQLGFTRLEGLSPNLEGEHDLCVKPAALSLATDWLPASVISSEGLWIQLNEELLRAWEARPTVRAREATLHAGYRAWLAQHTGASGSPPPIRFYLLHTLSHLLLQALALECGYAESAIRERIYCSVDGGRNSPGPPMAAILLSTGTPGSEGTLGGLVAQARYLPHHLTYAVELAGLCSNDPVCAAHRPADDPAERHLQGAACHGCLFVAECSCERFNQFLDRALVAPTLGNDPELAFFGARRGPRR